MRTPEQISEQRTLARNLCKSGGCDWNDWFKLDCQLEREYRASVEFHRKTPTNQLCAVAQLISETPNDEP